MHPDRLGKSTWVKVLPWYYTKKRKRSRAADKRDAVRRDCKATLNADL